MSKLSNTLKMLLYLNSRDSWVSIDELASEIEIGTREVRRYRDDLEKAGFSIESKTGRYGGYRLIDHLPIDLGMSQAESLLLNVSIRQNKKLFEAINSSVLMLNQLKKDVIIGDNYITDEVLYKLVAIQEAKDTLKQIKISYTSRIFGEGIYVIEPYYLKMARNHYYLHARHQGKLKMYRVDLMHEIAVLDEDYKIDDELYTQSILDDASGVFRGDKRISVKIAVYGQTDQSMDSFFDYKLTLLSKEKNYSMYSFDTYSLNETLRTLLSLGKDLRIIEPERLKKAYIQEIQAMLEKHTH